MGNGFLYTSGFGEFPSLLDFMSAQITFFSKVEIGLMLRANSVRIISKHCVEKRSLLEIQLII